MTDDCAGHGLQRSAINSPTTKGNQFMKKGLFIGLALAMLLSAVIIVTSSAESNTQAISWSRDVGGPRSVWLFDLTANQLVATWGGKNFYSGSAVGIGGHYYELGDGCHHYYFYVWGNPINITWLDSDPCIPRR
jgi:hypothetical protein